MPIRIRRGVKDDMKDVHQMVLALATTMGEPEGPEQTLEDLIRDAGFDPDHPMDPPLFHTFIAEEYDEADVTVAPKTIGYGTVTSPAPSKYGKTMLLVNLYVADEYRHKGIGRMLMAATARFGRENGVKRYIFYCFASNPAIKFYERLGAVNYTQKEGVEWYFTKLLHPNMN